MLRIASVVAVVIERMLKCPYVLPDFFKCLCQGNSNTLLIFHPPITCEPGVILTKQNQ